MKLLSIESSAVSAAVCITDGEKLVASSFQNCGLTHSRTILPMVEQLCANCGLSLAQMDGIAVASGPGSFTGVRIGVATVKGLAFAHNLPCVGVSTLAAMAHGVRGLVGTVHCVMDARAGQVYHAQFAVDAQGVQRLCPDRAVTIATLGEEIIQNPQNPQNPQILVGDGAELCYNKLTSCCPNLQLAPAHLRYPSAYGVAMAALPQLQQGLGVSAQALDATYLRKPQAEREREAKLLSTTTHG